MDRPGAVNSVAIRLIERIRGSNHEVSGPNLLSSIICVLDRSIEEKAALR